REGVDLAQRHSSSGLCIRPQEAVGIGSTLIGRGAALKGAEDEVRSQVAQVEGGIAGMEAVDIEQRDPAAVEENVLVVQVSMNESVSVVVGDGTLAQPRVGVTVGLGNV